MEGVLLCSGIQLGTVGYFALIQNVNDWEVDSLSSLLHCLASLVLALDTDDQGVWKSTKDAYFSAKPFYHIFQGLSNEQDDFPLKQIWRKQATPRLSFLLRKLH